MMDSVARAAALAAAIPGGELVRIPAILFLVMTLLAVPGLAVVHAADEEDSSSNDDSGEQSGDASDQSEAPPEAEPKAADEQVADDSQQAEVPVKAAGDLAGKALEDAESSAPDEASVDTAPGAEVAESGASLDSNALKGLRHALDQVAALQLLLVEGHQGDGPVRGQSELNDVRKALEDALVEVAQLERDVSLRQWLEGEGLKAALAEVDRLEADVAEATEVAEELEPEAPSAIETARLRGVKRAIADAPFKEGKMQVITDQLQNVRLRTEQVGDLVELFAFSRDKVDVLVFLYPRLTDPERFEDLLGTLKFAADRLSVRQRLGLGGS